MINNLADIHLFGDLKPEELDYIIPFLKERQFKKNHILMFENDESDDIYFLRSGMVKIYRMYEGKEVVLSITTPGDVVGEAEPLSGSNHRISTVEALEHVCTWLISSQDFLHIVDKYPIILKNAYKIMVERTRMLNRMIRYLTFYDVRGKVANLILDLYYNFGVAHENGFKIQLKINQTLLANMIGITRESFSKTLSEFQDEGLLELREKYLYLLNMKLLETICHQTEEVPALRKWCNK